MQPATTLMPAAKVRETFGGISDMTLWRWVEDEKLGFPKPRKIRGRRFWDAAEISAFIERAPSRH